MNIHKVFPSKYVSSADLLQPDGAFRSVTVTIDRFVEKERMGQPPNDEEKSVLYFSDAKKGMVLNKTNAMTIAGLYGPETDEWTGKRITLHVEKVKAFGAVHDAIRVRPQVPAPKSNGGETIPPPPPESDEPDVDYVEPDDHPFEDVRPNWANREQALLWAMDMSVCSDQPTALAAWESVALETLGKKTVPATHLPQIMDLFYRWAVAEMDKLA